MRRLVSVRRAQRRERLLPDFQTLGLLLQEGDLPVVVAQRGHAAVVGPVDELLPRPRGLAAQCRPEVVAVEVHLVVHAADAAALQQVGLDRLVAGRCQQRGQHVLVRADVVDHGTGLDDAGPLDEASARGNRLPSWCSSRRGTSWCRRRAR